MLSEMFLWMQHSGAVSSSVGRPEHAAEHAALCVADVAAIGSAEPGANTRLDGDSDAVILDQARAGSWP